MFVFCFLVKKNSKLNVCEGCKQMVSLTRQCMIMTDALEVGGKNQKIIGNSVFFPFGHNLRMSEDLVIRRI